VLDSNFYYLRIEIKKMTPVIEGEDPCS